VRRGEEGYMSAQVLGESGEGRANIISSLTIEIGFFDGLNTILLELKRD